METQSKTGYTLGNQRQRGSHVVSHVMSCHVLLLSSSPPPPPPPLSAHTDLIRAMAVRERIPRVGASQCQAPRGTAGAPCVLRHGGSLRPLGGFGRNWCLVVVAVVGKMQSLWSDRATPVARTADIQLFAVLWEQGTRRKKKE